MDHGAPYSTVGGEAKQPSDRDCARLISRYFLAQGARPPGLADVPAHTLSAFQSTLLVTDGTVTRIVEAHTGEPVQVQCLDDREVPAPDHGAGWLEIPAGEPVIRRRTLISGTESRRAYVLAESLTIARRLPTDFVSVFDSSAHGFGAALAASRLETRRELLWYGVGGAPEWYRGGRTGAVLSRSCRILASGAPVLLTNECFLRDAVPSTSL